MSRAPSLQGLFDLKVNSIVRREHLKTGYDSKISYSREDLNALLHEMVDATMKIHTDFAGQRTKLTFDQLREELFAYVQRDNNG